MKGFFGLTILIISVVAILIAFPFLIWAVLIIFALWLLGR